MDANAAGITLSWDEAWSIDRSQSWLLCAMKEHGPALVNMLWRILGNEQDVCDAYQDTFVQLAHCEQGTKPDHVKAYLFRSASNVAVSLIRRKQLEAKYKKQIAVQQSIQEHNHVDEIDCGELRQSLRNNIARLPEVLRNVIVLHDLGQLRYEQVATILGITAGTARVYRFKAVQLLAVWMDKKDGE